MLKDLFEERGEGRGGGGGEEKEERKTVKIIK